jgi:hypothetical protein
MEYDVVKETKLFPKKKQIPWVITLLHSPAPAEKWYIGLQAASHEREVVILECSREDYEKVIDILMSAVELDNIEVKEGPQCGR